MAEANIWQPRTIIEVTADTKMITQPFTALANQTLFTITDFAYTVGTGALQIYRNGKYLTPSVDFIEQTDTTFTIVTPSTAGDEIVAVGNTGISGTVDTRDTDIFLTNYQALRDYVGVEDSIYAQGSVTKGDGGEEFFQQFTGAAPGTYIDNNYNIIVPTGGNGSTAWFTASKPFLSVANMEMFSPEVGIKFSTLSHYTPNLSLANPYSGGGDYISVAPQAFDGYGDREFANGRIAVLQYSGAPNVRQFGAKIELSFDSTASIQAVIDSVEGEILLDAVFAVTGLTVSGRQILVGTGSGKSGIAPHSTYTYPDFLLTYDCNNIQGGMGLRGMALWENGYLNSDVGGTPSGTDTHRDKVNGLRLTNLYNGYFENYSIGLLRGIGQLIDNNVRETSYINPVFSSCGHKDVTPPTVTVNTTTNVFTSAGHGLENTESVFITVADRYADTYQSYYDSTAAADFLLEGHYFVGDVTTDTFQLYHDIGLTENVNPSSASTGTNLRIDRSKPSLWIHSDNIASDITNNQRFFNLKIIWNFGPGLAISATHTSSQGIRDTVFFGALIHGQLGAGSDCFATDNIWIGNVKGVKFYGGRFTQCGRGFSIFNVAGRRQGAYVYFAGIKWNTDRSADDVILDGCYIGKYEDNGSNTAGGTGLSVAVVDKVNITNCRIERNLEAQNSVFRSEENIDSFVSISNTGISHPVSGTETKHAGVSMPNTENTVIEHTDKGHVVITGNYTPSYWEKFIVGDTTLGALTVTLPSVGVIPLGTEYVITKSKNDGNSVTVAVYGGENIRYDRNDPWNY